MIGPAWLIWALSFVAAGIVSVVATGQVIVYLRRRQLFDLPNERSSHKLPTPRGGGLGVVPAILAVWAVLGVWQAQSAPWFWISLGGALVLMALSWADDRFNLPAAPRFLVHLAVVAAGLAAFPADQLVFGGWLPWWADRAAAALAWLWFVNLYNFMDGIDGITGVESASLGFGIALVAALSGAVTADLVPLGLAIAGAALGFLVWNWHPAKVFLGDVGSIPVGFLLGALLIKLALGGQVAAALILPAYYLADATITLGRRALKGEKIWQAHRQHFYQRAVQGGKGHDKVALTILKANVVLIAITLAAARGQVAMACAMAAATVFALLALLQVWSKGQPR